MGSRATIIPEPQDVNDCPTLVCIPLSTFTPHPMLSQYKNQFPYRGPILSTDIATVFQYQGQKAWAEVT